MHGRSKRVLSLTLCLFVLAACATTSPVIVVPTTGVAQGTTMAPATSPTVGATAAGVTAAASRPTPSLVPTATVGSSPTTQSTTVATATAHAPANATSAPAFYEQRDTPQHLLQSYYNAINRKEYRRAYGYWERPGTSATSVPPAYPQFVRGYADTSSVALTVGTPDMQGAAGSTYADVPVVLVATHTDGTVHTFYGCYMARRLNAGVSPSDPLATLWHLYNRATINVAPPGAAPAALLNQKCQP